MARISCWLFIVAASLLPVGAHAAPALGKTGRTACEDIQTKGNRFKGSQWECEARVDEAALMTRTPGLVARSGDSLTVTYPGHPAIVLTPPADAVRKPGQCDSYIFSKALHVQGQTAAEITCHMGEFENEIVVRPDGGVTPIYASGSASPDGRVVVVGEDKAWSEAALTVYDWPTMRVAARFKPACRVLKWTAPERAAVTCVYFPDAHDNAKVEAFDADLSRDTGGAWQLQATQWRDPNRFDRKTNLPVAVQRMWPLPHFSGH